jgi:predicted DNA-binding mobile mystery protein A
MATTPKKPPGAVFSPTSGIPEGGWIKSARKAVGMPGSELALRLGISRQGVAEMEKREVGGTITLNSLTAAAEQLGYELVYAFVPIKTPPETDDAG